jgi:Tfp pilus assembly protein PilX
MNLAANINAMFMSFPRRQRGASMLVATVFLLLIVALFGGIGLRLASTDITDTAVQNDSVEALFLAESGLERALQRLSASTCAAVAEAGTRHSLGRGDFEIQTSITVGSLCRVTVLGRVLLNGAMSAQRQIEGDLSVSSDTGWVVGQNGTIFMWDGSAWTTSGFTNNTHPNRDLNSVYCVTDDDCWAVGQQGTIAHWDGSVWDDDGVNEIVDNRTLHSVYCSASDDCWAVGNNGGGESTIAHWNGTLWDDISGAINNVPNRELFSVYCVEDDDCWAVGETYNSNGLIGHWDGSTWEDEGAAGGFTNSTSNDILRSVHCVDTDDCWAVGDDGTIARWNGTTNLWDDNGFTNHAPNEDLFGVFCVASDDCWAVGDNRNSNGTIVHWDGSSWEEEGAAGGFTNSTPNEDLNSVYCFGSGDCWAVGDDGSAGRLSGTTWTTVSTPTSSQNLNSVHFPDGGGSTSLQRWREIIQ